MSLKPIRGIPAIMEDGVRNKFLNQPLTQAELNQLIDLNYLP